MRLIKNILNIFLTTVLLNWFSITIDKLHVMLELRRCWSIYMLWYTGGARKTFKVHL